MLSFTYWSHLSLNSNKSPSLPFFRFLLSINSTFPYFRPSIISMYLHPAILHHAFCPFFWWAYTHLKTYLLHHFLFLLLLLCLPLCCTSQVPSHCSIGFINDCFLFPQPIEPFVHTTVTASLSMWQVLVCTCVLFIFSSPVLTHAYYKVINE